MAIYYASVGYVSTPQRRQEIPVGGNHALKFPYDEQNDPWGMHPRRLPDGHVVEDFLADNNSALMLPPVRGLATIQLEIAWEDGTYTRRHAVVGENQAYENNHHSRVGTESWTSLLPVTQADPFVILVGHDSPTPKHVAAARLLVAIQDDIAPVPDGRVKVRPGGETEAPNDPETPAEPGGGDPGEIPDWPH